MQILTNDIVNDGLILYLDAGIKGSYPSSGTTWTDLAGSNNGTLTSGPTFSSANGGSITFDGANDCITFSTSVANTSSSISFFFWFYTTVQDANYRGLWCRGRYPDPGGGIQTHTLFYLLNGIVACSFGKSDGSENSISAEYSLNAWQCFCPMFDGVNISCFKNGDLIESKAHTSTLYNTNQNSVRLASDSRYLIGTSDRHFSGRISNFLIYNRALSASEVTQNFEATRNRFGI